MLKRWLNKDKKMVGTMLFSPIFTVVLLCFLSSGLYVEHIPLAITDLDNSSLSRQIVTGFENHPGFEVELYLDSEADLQAAVYNKDVFAGLLIPADYGQEVVALQSPKALFLLDGSNSTVVGAAQGYAATIFSTLSAGVQIQALQQGGVSEANISAIMGGFTFVERNLYDPYISFMYNLIYMVLPYMIQMMYLCFFLLPLFWEARGKKKLTVKNNTFMFFRLAAMGVLVACSTYLALLVGALLFHIPVSANFLCHFALMLAYIFALNVAAFVISLFTSSSAKLYFFELYCIIGVLIMLTSGMVWPSFVTPSTLSTFIKFIWPFSSVVMPFKAVHLKGAGLIATLPTIGYCLLYGLCWLAIGIIIYSWQKRKNDVLLPDAA